MDAARVALLREVLAGTDWVQDTRRFAASLLASVAPHGGGLLLVGSAAYEPWHLAAHLDDEAAWSGTPELSPTLVRHRVPAGVPAHLAIGLGRLEAAGRGETLLVVTPARPGAGLLERVHDARRKGATVLVLDGGDPDLHALAHDAIGVGGLGAAQDQDTTEAAAQPLPGLSPGPRPALSPDLSLDLVQHLVSAAAGENAAPSPRIRRRFRDRLSRLADQLTSAPALRR